MPIKLKSSGGGDVTLDVPSTASTYTVTVPAVTGTVVTTGDTGSVAPTMLSTGSPSWTSGGVFSFNSGYGSSAIAYGCRAWVNFDGTTTPPSIRASGNVSSVARPATGYFTVNLTSAMPDTNYTTLAFCRDDGVGVMFTATNTVYSKTTSAFTFYTTRTNGTQSNSADVSFAAFR